MSKKEELEKKKKVEALRKREQEAKSTDELVNQSEASWKKSHGRGFTPEERQDARKEIEVGKKYKDVSPIMSKGNFNRNTPKENYGNTGITQDDVDRRKKKKH